tara:strand:- start:50856 stop:51215 length:360 start_codon:yes stop_codon:yes gene_type:complete
MFSLILSACVTTPDPRQPLLDFWLRALSTKSLDRNCRELLANDHRMLRSALEESRGRLIKSRVHPETIRTAEWFMAKQAIDNKCSTYDRKVIQENLKFLNENTIPPVITTEPEMTEFKL